MWSLMNHRFVSIRMSIEELLVAFDANQIAEATMIFRRYGRSSLDEIDDEDLSEIYGKLHEIQMNYSQLTSSWHDVKPLATHRPARACLGRFRAQQEKQKQRPTERAVAIRDGVKPVRMRPLFSRARPRRLRLQTKQETRHAHQEERRQKDDLREVARCVGGGRMRPTAPTKDPSTSTARRRLSNCSANGYPTFPIDSCSKRPCISSQKT